MNEDEDDDMEDEDDDENLEEEDDDANFVDDSLVKINKHDGWFI